MTVFSENNQDERYKAVQYYRLSLVGGLIAGTALVVLGTGQTAHEQAKQEVCELIPPPQKTEQLSEACKGKDLPEWLPSAITGFGGILIGASGHSALYRNPSPF